MKYNNFLNALLKLAICVNLFYGSALVALPEINQVTNGEMNILQPNQSYLLISQSTHTAILNWSSFNIDAGESVHFQQPRDGICLNRIDASNGMSYIYGSLTSTANIFLINPAGVLFGNNAQINVGGIVASTLDIADGNFIANKFIFENNSAYPGAIINRGVINVADKGLAALLGSSVVIEGIIDAKRSNVALASGNKITLDFYGNDVLTFDIAVPTTSTGLDEYGQSLQYGVDVSGQIINDGGHIFITAKAAQGVFDKLINTSGVIRAQTIEQQAGGIIILGHEGTVNVTGELNVSSRNEQAGEIYVFGEHINIVGNAYIDASSGVGKANYYKAKNGAILIGSSKKYFQYNIPGINHPNTKSVYVGPNVKISADTKNYGHGGIISIISDYDLKFEGMASAHGGLFGGNGGKIVLWSEFDYARPNALSGQFYVNVSPANTETKYKLQPGYTSSHPVYDHNGVRHYRQDMTLQIVREQKYHSGQIYIVGWLGKYTSVPIYRFFHNIFGS